MIPTSVEIQYRTEVTSAAKVVYGSLFYFVRLIRRKDARFGLSCLEEQSKGRDWYDFEWYVRHGIPLDFTHLHERTLQFNQEDISEESFLEKLKERLSTADLNQVKSDVLPFVRNPKELDIWSNDYFLQLADMIKFE